MWRSLFGTFASLLLIAALLTLGAGAAPVHAQGTGLGAAQDGPPPPTAAGETVTDGPSADDNWWAQAQAAIQAAEYEVNWQENPILSDVSAPSSGLRTGAYQAPNRGQGLRSYFLPEGILVVPRPWTGDGSPAWQLRLTLADAGPAELTPEGNGITYQRPDKVTEVYRNEPSGLTQRFEIAAGAEEQAILTLAVDTDLIPTLAADGQAVEFADAEGAAMLRYANLQAADAASRSLPVSLTIGPAGGDPAGMLLLQISVDAIGAAYPLTVTATMTSLATPTSADGLGASPAWTAESNQAEAWFGYSVATAGDVNGDGYADVVVGAYGFDNGQANEGRAYVYHGGPGGLSASPAWTAESNQADAWFGHSVGTAGDVNGDGYADVIVGAPLYTNGQAREGRAFVYRGGSGGLSASPAWTGEGNVADAYFGWSVAAAGDVNGDGYADVIVGAEVYSNDQAYEGRALVYHGSAGGLGASPAWTAEGNQRAAYFGESVATAGDVNGDGYADVIVGAPQYDGGQMDEGRAYVYHGGAGGLSASPAWTTESNQEGARYGRSVATAGDVGGDGYADVIVGAEGYDNGQTDEGRAYVYFGAAGGLDTFLAWTAEGNQAGANFGSSVGTAGDVNGDGYADVIAGAPNLLAPAGTGVAFVYYGAANWLNANAAWTAESNQANASLGVSVGTAGDVNGDGYADVIVGAPYYDSGQTNEGRAFVFHGAAGGLGASPARTVESNQGSAFFGASVATAGDVNGDGYADVIVGAPFYDNGQANEGTAFVYHGAATGLSTSPAWTAECNQEAAYFGGVTSAGDVNGDGYADVIVGANGYDNGQANEGRVYVYHGGPGGLSASPAWTAEGNQADALFGAAASAGDVNGDGYADVIVGAPSYDAGQQDEGRAFMYYGGVGGLSASPAWTAERNQEFASFGSSVGTAGDVNGDGYADVIVGATAFDNGQQNEGAVFVYFGGAGGLSGNPRWIAEGNQELASFGSSVGTAGDVNGDGYADVIVGAWGYSSGQASEGKVFVYHGSAGGLSAGPAWTAESNQAIAYFGWSVAGAGDANGDGYADVIVGAPHYDNGQQDEGRTYVYFGGASGLSASPAWTAESNQTNAYFGTSVTMAGDVNGDGYADVIVGAPEYDNGQTEEGRAYVYYGNGGGVSLLPRQRRADSAAPIAPGGRSDRPDTFALALLGRTPFGRGKLKMEWEVKPLGILFDGKGTEASPSWISTGTSGAAIDQLLTKLTPRTPYHWRVRLRYHPAISPFQQYSRWITMPWNGWNETDLRTAGGNRADLPLVLR